MLTPRALLPSLLVVLSIGMTTIAIADAPNVADARASLQTLWPPNHKFVPVSIVGVTSAFGLTLSITGCTSDEVVDADTAGVCVDAMIEGGELLLRAERDGQGNGRVYVIHFVAENDSGETTAGTVSVCVPHDQGNKPQCIDDGQSYDAMDCAPTAEDSGNAILRPNVPNPFNPTTRITFDLGEETSVRLSVYDATGRWVVTLVDGVRSAGEHTVTWEAPGIPSGVYFYRIVAGSVVETRKMTLLK